MRQPDILLVSILALASFAIGVIATAQTIDTSINTNTEAVVTLPALPDPGILPDSALYGVDLALERIGDIFVINDGQIRRNTIIAEERLAEAVVMEKKGNNKRAAEALVRAEDRLEKAAEKLTSRDDKDTSGRADLLLEVQASVEKHLTVLADVKASAPEAAQKGLETAIGSSSKVVEKLNEVRMDIISSGDTGADVKTKLESVPALENTLKAKDQGQNQGNSNVVEE